MNIRIQKLDDKAIIPVRQTTGSGGADLHAWLYNEAYEQKWIAPGETVKISTKLAIEVPLGYFGGIFARSGLATKMGLVPGNCVGVVDADYRGEIVVSLHNHSNSKQCIQNNERIAQLLIVPCAMFDFTECTELTATDRGKGGFGSTGKS